MNFRCCDVETTGLPADDDTGPATGLMEIGWTDFIVGEPIDRHHAVLVDCGIPVSICARATHHISDEMVLGELKPDEACKLLATGDHQYLVAHHIDHEKHYVGPGIDANEAARKWFCTYKTSLRLWPEADGHKLQELRYFLKVDDDPDFDARLADPPHRAGPDSYVCAFVLRKILQEAERQGFDVDRLVKWSNGPALLHMCFMKKHKNKPWAQVAREDRDYLAFIYDKSDVKDRDIRATVKYWLKKTAPIADGDHVDHYPT